MASSSQIYCVRIVKNKVLDFCFLQISECNGCIEIKSHYVMFVINKVLDLCFLKISQRSEISEILSIKLEYANKKEEVRQNTYTSYISNLLPKNRIRQ